MRHGHAAPAQLLPIAEEAARCTRSTLAAGKAERQRPVLQEGSDIKLREDAASEALIRELLAAKTALPVLGEEAGWGAEDAAAAGSLHWVVDPLDGSFNYYRGIPLYAVAIALCDGRTPLLGAIYCPEQDELFSGGPGLGLFRNGQAVPPQAPADQILATGFPARAGLEAGLERFPQLAREWRKLRLVGSAALSLAWLSAGRIDAYTEHGIMWWDVAAGLALAAAAGASTIRCEPVSQHAVNVTVIR